MDTQSQAQIYLADQRGHIASASGQSIHTFNFGSYAAEGREPLGPLNLFSEDSLAAGASLTRQVEEPTEVILLPIMGGLDYTCADVTTPLEPGQAGVLALAAGMTYTVTNPYPSESIRGVQCWLKKPQCDFSPANRQTEFDLRQPNRLVSLFGEPDAGYQGFIGRYGGRQEGTYPVALAPDGQPRRIFVFVIQGVFEIANRLLHEKDSLALVYAQTGMLEFEALSNDALLLLLDLQTA
ncbi:hypothetical protein GCM10027577_32300 [Spirosoma fluminis]